jgi:hypothetical protein
LAIHFAYSRRFLVLINQMRIRAHDRRIPFSLNFHRSL